MADLNTLSGVRVFSGLSEEENRKLEKSCRWKIYSAREQIISGEPDSRSVLFVVSGRVRVVDYSLLGQEVTFDDLPEGSHFGEMAAIDGTPRSTNVIALEECLIASMPPEIFKQTLLDHPTVGFHVISELARVVREADSRIMDMSTLGANSRVCAEILRQARSASKGPNGIEIRPIPVHGDIASRVSTTRETVARTMSDLARQGVIERSKGALLIHDLEGLHALVEADRRRERRSGQSRRRGAVRDRDTERRRQPDRRSG